MSRIRIVFLQGIFNLLFFVVVLGVFSSIHYLVVLFNQLFLDWEHADWHLYIRNILFAAIIFFFRPIWGRFNRYVDMILYPQMRLVIDELQALKDKILNEVDYLIIFNHFISEIEIILKANRLIIYFEKDENPFAVYRTVGIDEVDMRDLHPDFSDPLILKLLSDLSPIILTEAMLSTLHSSLTQRLFALRFRFIIPIVGRNELKGAVIIGDIYREGINRQKLMTYLRDIVYYLFQALEHAHLYQQAKRDSVEKGILMEIGRKITAYKDMREILNWMMDAIKKIVPYDAGGFFVLYGKDDTISYDVLRGYPEEIFNKANIKMQTGVVGWSIRTGKGAIIPDVTTDDRYFEARPETRSEIVVPLIGGLKVIGGFCLESNKLNAFTSEHYELLKTFASQAALVIENANLYFELRKKEEMDYDMEVARSIQRAFFPKELPNIKGYSIYAKSISCQPIGGDLYDLIPFENGQLGIAIGDSSGKGISGAILMAAIFASFRGRLKPQMEVNELVRKLNNSIMRFSEPGKYATFFYGFLDSRTGILHYTNAGHNYPILIRASGEILYLDIGGTVLGFFENLEYKKGEVTLQEGDFLAFYTDGVTEVFNDKNEEFGERRFINFLVHNRDKELQHIEMELLSALDLYSGGKQFQDDITLIFVKRSAVDAQSQDSNVLYPEKKGDLM